MTIIEKILAGGAERERVAVGEFVVCDVDMTALIDLQFATLWASPTRIADANRLAVIWTTRTRRRPCRTPTAASGRAGFVEQHGSSGSSTSGATGSATR